ncbi:histidine kinase [Geomonas limicola]|uniref:Histidine kinase n=1 Tax=Geomonas limicola TaxID=2740186 RepID=A0A6V8NAP4_9BACT|nr:histidine kinase [Geomonas limicola]GFO68934.1 histidine kinase [Geomonas limicola]
MSFKKTLLALTAIGALAGTAVPAMALENEFHGMYKMKYFVSDIDNASAGNLFKTKTTTSANNYFEQRARLFYNAKANDDLKLVVAFEIDSVFGDKSQNDTFRNSGAALDTDAVNLETKWVHLDFNIPGIPTNVKVGTQAIKDSLKGVLFDVDAAGIYTATKFGPNAKMNLGYFRGYESDSAAATAAGKMGVNNLDLVILEGKYSVTKDIAVGANYYGVFDYRDNFATMLDHTLGVNADATFGALNVSGFLAGQLGTIANRVGGTTGINGNGHAVDLSAIAANVTARMKVGPGTAKVAGLYTSGDDGKNANKNKAWQSLQQTRDGVTSIASAGTASLNTYNDSGMMLLNRNAAAQGTTTDRQLASTTNNNNQGMIMLTAGYDANITPKTYASVNAGVLWAAETRNAHLNDTVTSVANGAVKPTTGRSVLMGAELNVEAGYKLYDNLTASVQGAYVVLGNYYNGTNQKDPYTFRTVLSYAF